MPIIFRFNPITQVKDKLPENPQICKPPMTYDYSFAKVELGDKFNLQVRVTVKSSDNKVYERIEEFLIDKKDLEECIIQSIQYYLLRFGLTEDKILSLFENFNFDSSKTMDYIYI